MNILKQAESLIHGDRKESYGHCLDEYTRFAGLVSVAFAHKLKEPFTAEEMLMIMALLKFNREIRSHKDDNLVDLAGYTGCIADAIAEREKRGR
jgi:beta-glucosidase/6-phospho-beta-glucosidase/beta-galactosidase